jgi:hypothetical protein
LKAENQFYLVSNFGKTWCHKISGLLKVSYLQIISTPICTGNAEEDPGFFALTRPGKYAAEAFALTSQNA